MGQFRERGLMPPKRSSSAATPTKKAKKDPFASSVEDQECSFKNQEYFGSKGEQKKKKWKNLKQILDLPESQIGPQRLESFTCNIYSSIRHL